jgi:hypothetical protein
MSPNGRTEDMVMTNASDPAAERTLGRQGEVEEG